MGESILEVLTPFILGLGAAIFIGWFISKRWLRIAEERHKQALEMARLEAMVAAREIRTRAEVEMERRRNEMETELGRRKSQLELQEEKIQSALKTQEKEKTDLEMRKTSLENRESELHKRLEALMVETGSLTARQLEYRERIQKLANLTPEQAKSTLTEEVRRQCEDELRAIKREILQQGEASFRDEARKILLASMQRMASTPMHDLTATIVPIPNEAMKGRLIGREGRNIKSFESATGVTLLIDETPDSVLVSSFDPVRREVAKIALQQLVKDGRIHPASIEEAVNQANAQVRQSVIEFGEEALRKTRLNHVHPEVVSLLGKLRFRLSNNQNSLDHSIEVANLCSLLASELQLEPEVARRAGLLHDIGKSIEGDYEGSHAVAAANLLKRHGEDARVVNAVAAHHHEVPPESPYAGILMIADSVSAVRPGARSESVDSYLQRVHSLEKIAREFPGVQEAYAVQAGREIRVICLPDNLSDEEASALARRIRQRIEEEMQYPGSIKITVIREKRFVEMAK